MSPEARRAVRRAVWRAGRIPRLSPTQLCAIPHRSITRNPQLTFYDVKV